MDQQQCQECFERNQVLSEEICPDCGRKKARSAQDCANGYCPKWYAVFDTDADNDCMLASTEQIKPPASPGPGLEPSQYISAMADLWVSFGQDWDTFLMCSPSIADKIKEKTGAA